MNSVKILLMLALVFFLTMFVATTGCYNNCTHNQVDWEDSDEWHKIWYNKLDTNSNGEIDKLEYHGKEGKSEYGEYKPNKCLQW